MIDILGSESEAYKSHYENERDLDGDSYHVNEIYKLVRGDT